MDITATLTKELHLQKWQTEAVIRLIDEGNTIPFIARYRKEQHGNMNDEQLRTFDERLQYLRNLQERREAVIASIEEQGKMTDTLRHSIEEAMTQTALEDLYRPYKQKRRTRAMIAREKGLEPLADYILSPGVKRPVAEEAKKYINSEQGVPDAAAAIRMAEDIIAERISDDAGYRKWIRDITRAEGMLVSEQAGGRSAAVNKKLKARENVYENYYDFSEPVSKVPGHRVLAINRGEKEKFLRVHIEAPEEKILDHLYRSLCSVAAPAPGQQKQVHSFADLRALSAGTQQRRIFRENPVTSAYIREAVNDSYARLIRPSIETELRNELTDQAEDGAIRVFASNLEQLLMQPPVSGKVVLGWDPAFRTGCKLAVVDETGKVLDTTVIFPTEPQNKVTEAKKTLLELCRKYHVNLISVGNGTASRESEQVIADFIHESGLPIQYVITNEAGASVYSASRLATEEFPNFDVGQRSAASIARRVQDPLAELVKIDPKSIGVGQYQHDMNQTKLGETLTGVVEKCVNRVGVDVNTASAALLSYISGITKTTAKNIITWREENGRFRTRRDLLRVKGLGPKAYEQCAGFLRIRGGEEPLDMTAVHPESYEAARKLLQELGYTKEDVAAGRTAGIGGQIRTEGVDGVKGGQKAVLRKLSEDTGLGEYTLQDVIAELEKPGRDPREEVQGPVLRQDVLSMDDLKPGMELKGTVRNIVDFGAFVDIGVHQDGLVHISQLSDHFVKVGDIVNVKVLSVDPGKKRISLTMKGLN